MHRERVPQIQIPTLDPSKYPQDEILHIFDAINWSGDFQKSLWNRVTGIAESDPNKVFKDPENASSEEKKLHLQNELPRAKKMAREWLQDVLKETPRQDLVFFKQHICKMLLEHRDLLQGNKTEQSNNLFKGLLTLIFGSGGECHVAQEMKIKEAYLEIYKACNKETNQPPFLLMLELAYKNTTEQAFKDILNPVLQNMLEPIVRDTEAVLAYTQADLRREWRLRSLSRIGSLAFSVFRYLNAKSQATSWKNTQETLDLNSVHNFTRIAKLFGKPFNIATDTDEVAERTFSNIVMNPKGNGFVTALNEVIPLSLGKFYWDTQLGKIIQPWLATHFEEQTYFQLNDLTQWFHHLLEGIRTDNNTNEIDAMQEELQQEMPTINGHPLARYQWNRNEKVLVPTTQALLAFAYGINLLKIKDPQTPSFFNHLDKEMHVSENEDLDCTSLGRVIRRVSPFIERISRFLPEHIQEKLQELNEPRGREEITRELRNFLRDLVSHIDEHALFFAQ